MVRPETAGLFVFTAAFLYVYFAGLWEYVPEIWTYTRKSLSEVGLRGKKRG